MERSGMGSSHSPTAGVRRPIRPHVRPDQPAPRADHPRIQRAQHCVVREPIRTERGAVIAPN
jgi:hypothetical protein